MTIKECIQEAERKLEIAQNREYSLSAERCLAYSALGIGYLLLAFAKYKGLERE